MSQIDAQLTISSDKIRSLLTVLIGVHLRPYPFFQVQFLLLLNLFSMIFIVKVRPFDEFRKFKGNTGVLLNGCFIHILLATLVTMLLCFALLTDKVKV